MKKISIIIPVYNAAAFIGESLESVRKQTLKELEIICINDGSTDKTEAIILEARQKDPRIVLLQQKNAGSGAARNHGLSVATGEYIAFLDGDDWYPEDTTLETLYKAASKNGVDIAGGSFVRHFADGRVMKKFDGIFSAYTFETREIVRFADYQFDYGYHRFLYKRAMLEEHRIDFPSYKRFQDPPFFVRAMIAAKTFYSIPDFVYAYRKGHQVIKWDPVRVEGVILGLTDNLLMSRAEGLLRLHNLTYVRFVTEFLDIILKHTKGSLKLYFCLQRFTSALDPALLDGRAMGDPTFVPLGPDFPWNAYLGKAKSPAKVVSETAQADEVDALRYRANALVTLLHSHIESWDEA
jgi:glycosyltransferase involved in cell wall biosynthesis